MVRCCIICFFAVLMPVVSGCANFIRNYEATEDRVTRTLVGSKNDVVFKPSTPVDSEFTAVAVTVNKEKVKKIQVFIRGEVETPYSWWREFYEVPCGLVLVPVSLCSHILSVFTFGVYPFSFSNQITDLAYSGLNPALNWESESRSVKKVTETKEKMFDEQEEDKVIPISNAVILVQTGNLKRSLQSDKFGEAKVVLVGLNKEDSVFIGDREFTFSMEGEKKMAPRQLLINRTFANKLLRARAAIQRYRFGRPTGKKLVQTVKTLEEIKFNRLAFQLEKQELTKHKNNRAFMAEFNKVSME